MRTFNGSAYFDEFGLYVTYKTALFLVPMTLINLTSLAMLIRVFALIWKTRHQNSRFSTIPNAGKRRVYMDHEELYLWVESNN